MPLISRTLLALGSLLLIHACYSAHEHSSLFSSLGNPAPSLLPASVVPSSSSSSSSSTSSSLPLDVSLETLASVLLICIGLVLGAEELRPICWRVWAGRVERGKAEGGFDWLEAGRRRGFLDVRGVRRDFAEWVREREKD